MNLRFAIKDKVSWCRERVGILAILLLLAGLAGGSPLGAQTNFTTILTNGPASNRVNVVIFAEGYRAVEYPQFLASATNVVNAMLATEPFSEYKPYLNFFAIAVPSVESGSDHPNINSFRNTYFNSTYDLSDYLITIPTNASGQGKVDALAATYMPLLHLPILVVNDNAIGGSDNGGRTAITSKSVNSLSYVPVHEAGHVLGQLGDEYPDAYPGFPDIEEPNTTRETNRTQIKWNAWIAPETPVPTPVFYSETVGLFEGAHYHTTGWFRPKLNCLMNGTAGVPFCEVCREALILSFYRRSRPIQSSLPTAKTFATTSNAVLNFSVTQLQPMTHPLSIQWFTNGIAVGGATNVSFSLSPSVLGNGANVIAGRINDPTSWVRTDPTNALVQIESWTVTVSLPQLQLKSPRWLGGGKFAFQVSGIAPQGFVVQGSSNLQTWTALSTNALVSGVFDFTNQTGGLPLRWYRAVTQP